MLHIWCTTSWADILLQDNEFFFISILLYDYFTFFSFFIKMLKNLSWGCSFIFLGLPVCKKISFSLLDSKKNWYKIWNFYSTRNSYEINLPPISCTLVLEQCFQLVCIGSKKSPPMSRVNKHQWNNNKRVRRECSFLEIARGEGLRAVQLGKSSLLIHPLLVCTKPREWLQEERQSGILCLMSSDEDYCMECCCKQLLDNLKLRTTTSWSILLL